MVYVCMAQDTEWACQKGEEGVDTLQAAKLLAVSVTVREKKFKNLGMQSK